VSIDRESGDLLVVEPQAQRDLLETGPPGQDSQEFLFVRIGDEAIGWTPIRDLPVPAGTHVLSLLRNPRWQPDDRIDQKIQVNAKQETTVQFDLESDPPVLIVNGRRIEYVPPQPEGTAAATTPAD